MHVVSSMCYDITMHIVSRICYDIITHLVSRICVGTGCLPICEVGEVDESRTNNTLNVDLLTFFL